MNPKNVKIIIVVAAVLTVGGIVIFNKNETGNKNAPTDNGSRLITVFKSPNCGCCVGYVEALKSGNFTVEVRSIDDMNMIKDKYNIPQDMRSCHTAAAGKYFIEGHVPLEAVKKLLDEKPEIDGIALPRMPAGSPGMEGTKKAPFEIYQLINGEYSKFMRI